MLFQLPADDYTQHRLSADAVSPRPAADQQSRVSCTIYICLILWGYDKVKVRFWFGFSKPCRRKEQLTDL